MNLLLAPFRWVAGLFDWIHKAFCALMDPEGRRAWAVMIAFGCGITMTGYASAVLWLVRGHAMLAFWLGLAAMFIILVVITAFTGLLVKRNIGGTVKTPTGEASLTFSDKGDSDASPPIA